MKEISNTFHKGALAIIFFFGGGGGGFARIALQLEKDGPSFHNNKTGPLFLRNFSFFKR